MEWANVAIAIAAVVISLGGLLLERRARRAETELIRQQMAEHRRAKIVVTQRDTRRSTTQNIDAVLYDFLLTNTGKSAAYDIGVTLLDPNCGGFHATDAGSHNLDRPLMPGESSDAPVTLLNPGAYVHEPHWLRVGWNDDDGRHNTDVELRQPDIF